MALTTSTLINQLPYPFPSIPTTTSFPSYCPVSTRTFKSCNLLTSRTKNPPRLSPVFAQRVSNLRSNRGFWEEPDNGSGSEDEDEEEEEEEEEEDEVENDLDFESDWDEEQRVGSDSATAYKPSVPTDVIDDQLLQEVEQLLEPDEKAILLQNVAPNMAKISTKKWSALHSLALAGQIPHMDIILGNELDIDLIDKDGRTALHTAVMGKKEAVISHLLRKGASPHVRDYDGASPLHYAVQVGALQTVKLLIKYNVDLNTEDNEGWTPLHIAVQTRNRDITKVLLVNGADKNRRNKAGKTPLDLALCYGKDFKSYDLAKLLKEMVALSGAHTIGFSHCTEISTALFNFSKSSQSDPTLSPRYAEGLRNACSAYQTKPSLSVFNDVMTPRQFDNVYFQNLQKGLGLLASDRALYADTRTRPYVDMYARNETAFFEAFRRAMEKLSEVEVKTGRDGEIRRRCDAFN